MSDGGIDIAKVVSLIMENPRLIEEISAMAKKESVPEGPPRLEERAEPEKVDAEQTSVSEAPDARPNGRNRSRLLGALKPYVSKDRAQAIDSMLSIVEILDAMKRR